ncbi:unnamed protein product [Calicophoron daubneyi]|uniref:Uncharacterized protein n=1 Tax=Calicophoron daubneyi TaxID=300641 RepID=A0AAV2T9L7_CALDB
MTYGVAFTGVLIALILSSDWLLSRMRDSSVQDRRELVYIYEGSLNMDSLLFVHITISGNVLVRLTPLRGDTDLFVATDYDYKALVTQLPTVHRSKFSPKSLVYPFNISSDQVAGRDGKIAQLFSFQSSTLGVEEVAVLHAEENGNARSRKPVLICVQPYPDFEEDYLFRLEVLRYRPPYTDFHQTRKAAMRDSLTFEQLAYRYATLAENVEGSYEESREKAHSVETKSQPITVTSRVMKLLNSMEPVLAPLADNLFDILNLF